MPGGLKGRLPSRGQGAVAVGKTQSARATKYIEFHGSVREVCEVATRVSPGAQLAQHRESAAAASCRKQVRLTGRKLRQLVQIHIGYAP